MVISITVVLVEFVELVELVELEEDELVLFLIWSGRPSGDIISQIPPNPISAYPVTIPAASPTSV